MASSGEAVAVVLYGNLGDWDHAEIVHPGAASEGDPTAEYSKTVVAETQAAAMDIIDDYGVEDVTVVRPEASNDGEGLVADALATGASADALDAYQRHKRQSCSQPAADSGAEA